jgi:hypothetical protein
MNTKELNFAYKVRHALNENIDNLPAASIERLAAARSIALSRKKKDSPLKVFAPQRVLAAHANHFFNAPFSYLSHGMSAAIPLLVLVVGLAGIYQFNQQQRISDIADLDVAVLSDELPVSAYLDHGFNAYLANRGD